MKRFLTTSLAFLVLTVIPTLHATPATVNYTYDEAGRLIRAEYDDGKFITYTYDAAGNIVSVTTGSANQSPVAQCQNVTVPTDPGVCTATSASVDASSFDPDGDPMTLDQSPSGLYNLGATTVTLTVTDNKGGSASCNATVTVVDQQPPAITCPDNQTVECTGPEGASVSFSATASDNCSAGITPSCTPSSGSPLPLGTTTDTCTATDGAGNQNACSFTVTVVDTTPPVINSVTANPDVLWPPNHKMVPVTVTVSASDLCNTAPSCRIASVSSNEPIEGLGDGDAAPDWEITGDLTVNLRAERLGEGSGRIYSIAVECTDASRNSSMRNGTVTVPHNKGKQT